MKTISTISAALCLCATVAFAQSGYQAKPGVYDPDKTNSVTASWVNGIGESDPSGNTNFGLLLQKNTATATNAAAGASITGVNGITLTQIGFDIKDGTQCSGGAPRFNVQATDGFHFIGGCSNGTPMPAPTAGWTRETFDPTNPAQAFPVITPGATIISITLIMDEGTDAPVAGAGTSIVDNININGTFIGKPGNQK